MMYSCCMASLLVLTGLTGCTSIGNIKTDMADHKIGMGKGAEVERLQDGREGFVIRENTQMDEASRRDFDLAVRMLDNDEYSQAADLLEKIIEHSPGVTAPYINMAIACRHLDRLEEAEEHLKAALTLVPEHPVACNEYGLIFRMTGRFNDARDIYEKAIASFPDYYPLHKNLGILCDLYLDDQLCALDHYEIYNQAIPQDQQVSLWVADLRIRLGQN
jgi:Tfp pilus assembly protein PilF